LGGACRPGGNISCDHLPRSSKLRDKAAKAKGRRFGNYVLQVVRLVLEWGKERGWRKATRPWA
jgi:hypothetical protein